MDIRNRLLLLSGKKHKGNSILCNGTTYINCGSDTGLDNLHAAAFTAEGWFYVPTFTGNYKVIFGKNINTDAGWVLRFYSFNTLNVQVRTNITDIVADFAASILNAWHHLAVCYDNAGDRKAYVYIDGTLVKVTAAADGTVQSDASYNYAIAALSNGANPLPSGSRVGWNRVSNYVRYTENFTPVSRLTPPDLDANTLALWKMNEGTGTTLDNAETTAARDGTIVNGAWVYSP